MPVNAQWVQFGDRTAYLAVPERAQAPLPGVLVVQEVWGVDGHIEDVTRRVAAAGYVALAPDLYAPGGHRPAPILRERVAEVQRFMNTLPAAAWSDPAARGAALAQREEGERARLDETYTALFAQLRDLTVFVPALRDAVRYLRTACPEAGGPVACVGFCMGGGLSSLLACEEPALAGAAIFYGSAPPLDRVPAIQCPLTGFYGALDARINAGLPAFAAAMEAAGKPFEHQVYEGAAHAFFNDTRPSYHIGAARDAFARLLTFLQRTTSG